MCLNFDESQDNHWKGETIETPFFVVYDLLAEWQIDILHASVAWNIYQEAVPWKRGAENGRSPEALIMSLIFRGDSLVHPQDAMMVWILGPGPGQSNDLDEGAPMAKQNIQVGMAYLMQDSYEIHCPANTLAAKCLLYPIEKY